MWSIILGVVEAVAPVILKMFFGKTTNPQGGPVLPAAPSQEATQAAAAAAATANATVQQEAIREASKAAAAGAAANAAAAARPDSVRDPDPFNLDRPA